MSNISTWSTTAADNNETPPNGFPELMNPADLNNSSREVMAAVRRWYEDPAWIDYGDTPTRTGATTFTITGDVTTRYVAGLRIRCTDSSTLYGVIASSSYSAPNTTVTVTLDSGSLSASLTAVALCPWTDDDVLGLGTAAYVDTGTSGETVPLLNGNNTYSGTAEFTGSSLSYTRSGATPTLTLSREDAQAALTAISYIATTGKNDVGALLNVIRLVNYFTNVASGSEETRMQIESYIAGAATVIARFGPGVSFGNPTGGVPTTAGQLNATGYRVNNVLQPVLKSASLGNISSGVYTSVQAINTTVARTGTGTFTYTFGTAEADANYYVDFCCVEATSGGGGADAWIAAGTKTTTGFTIETGITGISPSDPDQLMVKVWRIS